MRAAAADSHKSKSTKHTLSTRTNTNHLPVTELEQISFFFPPFLKYRQRMFKPEEAEAGLESRRSPEHGRDRDWVEQLYEGNKTE